MFYVFHGEDEFTRAETLAEFRARLGHPDTADFNTTLLDGGAVTLAELRHATDAVPFLTDKRLVIVEGLLTRLSPRPGEPLSAAQRDFLAALADYLLHLPETTRLVFAEPAPLPETHPIVQLARQHERGFEKRFDPPDAKSLPGWVQKRARHHGGEIIPRAAVQLAALIGSQLRLLDQELFKLVTYAGDRPVEEEDVARLVPYAQAAVIFDLVDALGQRDGRKAAETLHRLLDAGEHPLGLLAMIVRQFRLLIQTKELSAQGLRADQVARKLGLHPFPARKLYAQAANFSAAQLEQVFRRLLDTDVAIKTGQTEPEVALDLLVAGLASSKMPGSKTTAQG